MKRNIFNLVFAGVLIITLVPISAFAQQDPAVPQGELRALAQLAQQAPPLARLKSALQQAGAPALTGEEEVQIKTLIANYRTANPPPAPRAALQAAHRDLINAILNGQSSAAAAQAAVIVNIESANSLARLKAQADFAIAIIGILRTNSQADPLVRWMGASGVVGLARSLVGG